MKSPTQRKYGAISLIVNPFFGKNKMSVKEPVVVIDGMVCWHVLASTRCQTAVLHLPLATNEAIIATKGLLARHTSSKMIAVALLN